MKSQKLKTKIQALVMSGLVIFFIACNIFIACNNSDYTKSPSNTPANNDSAVNADTTASMEAPGAKKTTATKKKGKVTIGSMAGKGTAKIEADKTGVYDVADVMPEYPGGQSALENYMNNNVEFPQDAIDNNSEGTVDVQFVVDENGKVTDAKAVGKELGNGLDQEAVKVVSNMPKWTPGKVKGKNVKTRVVLPVTYKLQE